MSENTTHESPAYEKRGYLNHEFRLFHLRGQMDTPVAYHYHDFHKVLILLNGEADYIVEGRSYHLRPLDIVLVGAHCLHKPVVPYHSRYERIILYLSPECLDAFSCADCALDLCFQLAREQQSDVLRLGSLTMTPLLEALSRLENAYQAGGTNDNGTNLWDCTDSLFQLCPTHLTAVSQKTIWHDHSACHFFTVFCLQYISCKAVSCCSVFIDLVSPCIRCQILSKRGAIHHQFAAKAYVKLDVSGRYLKPPHYPADVQ